MSCITIILELKGDKPILPLTDTPDNMIVIEGGGTYKGHEFMIVFVERGHRCGYVALKENATKKFEKERNDEEYFFPDLECHGGITFYDDRHAAKDLLRLACSDIWIGFDAAHYRDLCDEQVALTYFPENLMVKQRAARAKDELDRRIDRLCEHRTYAYMENECKLIIDQLVEIENAD